MIRFTAVWLCMFGGVAVAAGAQTRDCSAPPGFKRHGRTAASIDATLETARWFAERGQHGCAAVWFGRAFDRAPRNLEACLNTGIALVKARQESEAVAVLLRCRSLAADDERISQALEFAWAQALAQRPLTRASVDSPDRAAATGPRVGASAQEAVSTLYELGLHLGESGRWKQAEEAFRAAVQRFPDHPKLRTALGRALVRQGRAAEAVAHFRRVEELTPNSALAAMNTAIALADAARLSEAAEKLREAIAKDPQLSEAHRQLGRVLLELRDLEAAREANLRALTLRPDDPTTLSQLGLLETLSGRAAQAAAWYEKAVAAGAQDAETLFKFGKALVDSGQPEAGLRVLRQALEKSPDHRQALYVAMRILARHDPDEARRLQQRLREAQESARSVAQARLLANLALQAAENEDWAKASDLFREALEACGSCADRAAIHRNFGLVLAQARRYAEALAELSRALALDPEDRDARIGYQILSPLARP